MRISKKSSVSLLSGFSFSLCSALTSSVSRTASESNVSRCFFHLDSAIYNRVYLRAVFPTRLFISFLIRQSFSAFLGAEGSAKCECHIGDVAVWPMHSNNTSLTFFADLSSWDYFIYQLSALHIKNEYLRCTMTPFQQQSFLFLKFSIQINTIKSIQSIHCLKRKKNNHWCSSKACSKWKQLRVRARPFADKLQALEHLYSK